MADPNDNSIRAGLPPEQRARVDEMVALTDREMRARLVAVGELNPTVAGAVMLHMVDRLIGYRQALDAVTTASLPSNGVDTSDAAARRAIKNVAGSRLRVLAAIAVGETAGRCLSAEGVEPSTGLSGNTIRPRIGELAIAGYIVRTGTKAPTRAGGEAHTWRLTDDGWRKLVEVTGSQADASRSSVAAAALAGTDRTRRTIPMASVASLVGGP